MLAFSAGTEIDGLLADGQRIDVGDGVFEVLHTPGHSFDSICLYAPSEKTLFSGDVSVRNATAEHSDINSLLKIACRDIDIIYASNEEPIMKFGQDIILQTIDIIRHKNRCDEIEHANTRIIYTT